MSRLGPLAFCAALGLLACALAQTSTGKPTNASTPVQAQADALKKALQRIADLETELAASKERKKPAVVGELPHANTRSIVNLLNSTIDTKDLQERVKLRTALEVFSDSFDGKLVILVNRSGFAAEFGPDSPDPYEEEVSLPPQSSKMRLGTALRLILSQIANGKATYIIRNSFIEIVPESYDTSRYFLNRPNVAASFERRPLPEVLEELAAKTAATIHLDPNIVKRNELLVSAAFRNISLEEALVVVTEMAQLKFVVLERTIYVTTRENAKLIEQEETARSKKRKVFESDLPPFGL